MTRKFENCVTQVVSHEESVGERRNVNLPEDLMVEILAKVTNIKCLLRFKSVSKAWHRLITSPGFIAKHLTHQKQNKDEIKYLHLYNHIPDCHVNPNQRKFCPQHHKRDSISLISMGNHNYAGPIETFLVSPFPADFDATVISVVGSSNGLVCLNFHREGELTNRYGIWNPATRKFKDIPNIPQICPWNIEPLSTSVSFSFIPRTGSYELVKIFVYKLAEQGKKDRYVARVHVLSMGANCWREVLSHGAKDGHELPGYIGDSPAVANSCLYWLSSTHMEGSILLLFDLEKEEFRQTSMAGPFYDRSDISWAKFRLTGFAEDLVLLIYVSPNTEKESNLFLEAWICDGMNGSWTKKIKLGPFPKDDDPIGYLGSREMIIRHTCYFSSSSYAYLYKPYSKQTRSIICRDSRYNFVLCPYLESLVQV